MGRNINGRAWILLTNRKHKVLFFSTIDVSSKRKMEFKRLVYSGLIACEIYHVRTKNCKLTFTNPGNIAYLYVFALHKYTAQIDEKAVFSK